jgi:chemotaxis protein histidine kinase CheA
VDKDNELAEWREKERVARDARDEVQKEKLATEKQIAALKEDRQRDKLAADKQVAVLMEQQQKEKLAMNKQLATLLDQQQKDKLAMDKQLAAVKDSEKKERQAKEQLQKEKAATEKLLADAPELAKKEREAKEQLQKEKAATEKLLASTKDSEQKERDAKDKLAKQIAEAKDRQEKERQLAAARDKERKELEDKDRAARQKLAQGPDLPSDIPSKIYCPTLDENQQGTDIYVHCATQPALKAKMLVLHYRAASAVHYNSLAMERSPKGWFAAVIPASSASGKVIHYFIEAVDGNERVIAKDGKPASPNVMALRPRMAPPVQVASSSDPTSGGLIPAADKTPVRGRKDRAKRR